MCVTPSLLYQLSSALKADLIFFSFMSAWYLLFILDDFLSDRTSILIECVVSSSLQEEVVTLQKTNSRVTSELDDKKIDYDKFRVSLFKIKRFSCFF